MLAPYVSLWSDDGTIEFAWHWTTPTRVDVWDVDQTLLDKWSVPVGTTLDEVAAACHKWLIDYAVDQYVGPDPVEPAGYDLRNEDQV